MAMELASRLSKATDTASPLRWSSSIRRSRRLLTICRGTYCHWSLRPDLTGRRRMTVARRSQLGNNSKLENLSEHELAALLEKKFNVL